jgi:hypothetical protein
LLDGAAGRERAPLAGRPSDLTASRATLRQVNCQCTGAIELLVPGGNRCLCGLLFHVNETEATTAVGLTVQYDLSTFHFAILGEEFLQILITSCPR